MNKFSSLIEQLKQRSLLEWLAIISGAFFFLIVGFYLVGLLVETLLAVRLVNSFKEEQASKAA